MELSLENVKKVVLNKYIEEVDKEVEISIDLSLIDFKWESLLFSANDENFATLICGDTIIKLVTNGEVKIIDTVDSTVYKNGKLSKGIIESIKNGSLYAGDRYLTDNSNWFAIQFGKILKKEEVLQYHLYDDIVYESEAKNINEFVEDLINAFIWFSKAEAAKSQ